MEQLFKAVIQNYQRGVQFFINSNRYTPFKTEAQNYGINQQDLISVSLECSGHGSFQKKNVAARFLNHLAQILTFNKKITKIKLKISGFDLNQNIQNLNFMPRINGSFTFIKLIVDLLDNKISQLTSFEIRVSQVTNCSAQDFKSILNLGVNQAAKSLTNLSCQFSDWTFSNTNEKNIDFDKFMKVNGIKKTNHDRNYQPSFQSFFSMLNDGFDNTLGNPMQDLKKFRLQISTWYYSDFQAELFFYGRQNSSKNESFQKNDKISPRIQHFHHEFKTKVDLLIKNIMPSLTNMEIDLRNWNKIFEMGILKGALLNINNNDRQNSLSQISKRHQKTKVLAKSMISMALKQTNNDKNMSKILEQMKQQEQENIEDFFDLNVVV